MCVGGSFAFCDRVLSEALRLVGMGVLREVAFSRCCRCWEYALIIERSPRGGNGTEYQNHAAKKSKFALF